MGAIRKVVEEEGGEVRAAELGNEVGRVADEGFRMGAQAQEAEELARDNRRFDGAGDLRDEVGEGFGRELSLLVENRKASASLYCAKAHTAAGVLDLLPAKTSAILALNYCGAVGQMNEKLEVLLPRAEMAVEILGEAYEKTQARADGRGGGAKSEVLASVAKLFGRVFRPSVTAVEGWVGAHLPPTAPPALAPNRIASILVSVGMGAFGLLLLYAIHFIVR
eukprot:GCRY01007271.1.p1 GENE.GCRY01007271.1~~GCRY01007271.1.p1  ORF type:complete len:222 (-),score=54.80 GCRY01007271.1:361-1026(-)